jgi:hypothetical protein
MVFSRLVVALFVVVVLARPAFAYLDPNASSVLLQVLLGGVAGVAIAARLFWGRIVGVFRRSNGTETGNEPGEK